MRLSFSFKPEWYTFVINVYHFFVLYFLIYWCLVHDYIFGKIRLP